MDNEIEFKGFKFFKTEFRFKNQKCSGEYFNNILLKSCRQYIDARDDEYDESIYILLSWIELLLYSSIVFLALSLLSILTFESITPTVITLALSVASAITRFFLDKKLITISTNKVFTKSMLEMSNYELLEEMRQELIDKHNNIIKVDK